LNYLFYSSPSRVFFNFIGDIKTSLYLILTLFFARVRAQEYNYIHYDTRDGLAGSTVYHMCQDKKGYIWFATDNGVSMFDGKVFRNFTTEDGLTDNEVLYIDSDGKGRVWMMPFNKTVCYYYEGKIHNNRNDSSLKKISFSSYGLTSKVNKLDEIYFLTSNGIFLYKHSGELKQVANYKQLAEKYSLEVTDFAPLNIYYAYPYEMLLYNRHSLFMIKDDTTVYVKEVTSNPSLKPNFFSVDRNLNLMYPDSSVPNSITSGLHISHHRTIYTTIQGAWMLDTLGRVIGRPFLAGKKVSNALEDSEGNIWFSTIGEGVFRLTSTSMKTFTTHQEAFCIEKAGNRIYAGYADGSVQVVKDLHVEKEYHFFPKYYKSHFKRLYTMKTAPSGVIYLGFDSYIARLEKGKLLYAPVRPIKSIDIVDDQTLVVSTNHNTVRLNSSNLTVIDTIWEDRGTKVIYHNSHYYIGTLDGLMIIDSNGNAIKAGKNNPLLEKRIVDMCKMPDGSFWIATSDNGVLLFKNGQVDTVINTKNGLGSNICKSIFLKDQFLWVGTNKGVNKIDVHTKKVLLHYSVSDGLASDDINAIYADDEKIWVCSPEGLTYFTEKDISGRSVCRLDLTGIYVSNKKITTQSSIQLPYNDNNISFEYTAISFKSAGDITYHYKLTGLDKDWKETKLTTLSYPSLPPGDYEFQLHATNKFGTQSETIRTAFSIAAPFWKTWWFWTGIILLALATIWYIFRLRYRRIQQRVREKNRIEKKMAELEQASLRAQMNPHFIFNCLNSIQHLMLKNDTEQTNRYVIAFGDLIRQTLYNSGKLNISITDEVRYLTNYLELEKLRFSSSFSYNIHLDKNILADDTLIPSMMLQPFAENAIRHGIRYKEDSSGLIKIEIWKDKQYINLSVEDNGIGREAARKYKSEQHIEYQSKGITLTKNRLDILTTGTTEKINMNIIDLKDENSKPIGTKVLICFPLSVIEKLA
jgi:ligand-binding sensor domain-containing protein